MVVKKWFRTFLTGLALAITLAPAADPVFAVNVMVAPDAKLRFFDSTGVPLAGGKLFTYAAGTTTKQTTYTDSTAGTQNTNPVILDSQGYASVWLDQTLLYKFTLSPSTDTDPPTAPIWTVDGLNGNNLSSLASLALSTGAGLVGFSQSASAAAGTVGAKLKQSTSIVDPPYSAKCDGTTDDSAAIQAAINSTASIVTMPPGVTCSFATTLTIDRALRFEGGASTGDTAGNPGPSTTKLLYTGTADAIDVVGSTVNGKASVHLSNFSLWGSGSAQYGINFGSGTQLTMSSIKNVHIRSFSQTGYAGLRVGNVLVSVFENLMIERCYYGITDGGASTTLKFDTLFLYGNTYGLYLTSINSSKFINVITDGSQNSGLYVNAASAMAGNDFFGFYSEADNQSAGTAPIYMTGAGGASVPLYWNFYGGYLAGAVAGLSIDLDKVASIRFDGMELTTLATGFIRQTANTINVAFRPVGLGNGTSAANVSGWTVGGVVIEYPVSTQPYSITLVGAGSSGLATGAGVWLITDNTHNKTALISQNGSAHTVTILADPDAGFSNISGGSDSKVHLYYSSGYAISNGWATGVNITAQVMMAGQQ